MRPGLAAQQKFCGSVRITAQFLVGRCTVADRTGIFSSDLFKFFRELGRNNQKAWMDENREGYRELVVAPFRVLLRRLEPAVQKLNAGFMVSGRVGENFSRINRDIRCISCLPKRRARPGSSTSESRGRWSHAAFAFTARVGLHGWCRLRGRAASEIRDGSSDNADGWETDMRATGIQAKKANGQSTRAGP
jgi:hypothetical protein